MWNTSAARLKISVHSSGPGIAQRLYFPAASGCPPTTMSLLRAIVVAVSAPGHHTLPHGTTPPRDRKSTRLNSSHGYISYAVFCLKKKTQRKTPERQNVRDMRCVAMM